VGSRLLDEALKIFRSVSANGAWLEVRVSNLRAIKFYLDRGFDRIKTIWGYYGDGEDAEILYISLSS
jgi:ribosomal protein S18 acetylase RimI-like enzyme